MSAWVGIGRSDVGLVRASNQDAFVAIDRVGLWAVADGMGGHIGGGIAAQTAIASVKAQAELLADPLHQGHQAPAEFLTTVILQAHHAILGRAHLESQLKDMGTTIVMLLILPTPTPTAYVAHLGDSRAYRFRSGTLAALTRDHSLMEKYLERGILTPESARTHPERHVLTRALGMSSPVKPDIASYPLEPHDLFLLCSDGLTKMLEDNDIREMCLHANGDPILACDSLIAESLARGGKDNVTVVAIAHP